MKMFRKLVSIVAAATLLTSSLAFTFSAIAAQVEKDSAVASESNLQANVEDGVILHAFNWSYNAIKQNLPQIAAAGYSTVQTSPVTQPKDYGTSSDVGGQWWKLYQPVSMSIAQSSWLGTKADLTALCAEADNYGIKIICDIVANHMANYVNANGVENANALSKEVLQYEPTLYNSYGTYFHSETFTAGDGDASNVTRGHVSACPDLNTANTTVQTKIYNLLKDCIDCGVDGFRFDAAKHIEVEDDASVGSQFWVNTLDAAKSYYSAKTGKTLFAYGEILNKLGDGRNLGSYTKRMRVTENKSSDNVLVGVNNGSVNAASASNYQLSGDASKAVLWAESHDTYMGNAGSAGMTNTAGVSDEKIVKAWAIVASRAKATALFFARPGSALMGEAAGDLTYKSSVVSEINKFHNAFANVTTEKVGTSGSMVYVARGTGGVVISNLNGNAASASISGTGLADGNYVDTVTGNAFTVSGGTLTGQIGSTGVAVVYNATATPKATASVESGGFTTDTMTVQLALENAVSGTYALDDSTPATFTGTPTIRIGSDYNVGETITLNLTATDAAGTTKTNTYYYTKKASTASGVYVFLNPTRLTTYRDFNCYIYDEDTNNKAITYSNGGWPGEAMKIDSATGYYYCEVPATCVQRVASTGVTSESNFNLATSSNTCVIINYNGGSAQYPGSSSSTKLKLNGKSHMLGTNSSGTKWAETTLTPTVQTVEATDVTRGQGGGGGTTAPPETTIEETTIEETTIEETTIEETTIEETTQSSTKYVEYGRLGDVNMDGTVTITDATAIQMHLAEYTPLLSGTPAKLADVDQDGAITIKDVTYIQMFCAEYANYAHVNEILGEYVPIDGETFRVDAKSNLFADHFARFDTDTQTLTVTYFINSEKDFLSTDWLLTYDGTVLQLQGTTGFMPFASGATYNTDFDSVDYGVHGNISMLGLAPLKTANGGKVAFVTATFNVLKAEDTTVNLNVTDLCVSKLNAGETTSKEANETDIIDGGVKGTPDSAYTLTTSIYSGAFNADYTNAGDPTVVYDPNAPITDPIITTEPTDPIITTEPTDPPTTRTIEFTDNQGWGAAYIYYVVGDDENAAWPGVPMTLKGDNGFGGTNYTYDIPTNTDMLIFNSGSGIYEGGQQTVNIPYSSTAAGWYPTVQDAEGKWEVDFWTDGGEDPTVNPSDPSGTRTIEFTDNKGWGQAYIYVYGPDGENAAWPGVPMTLKGDNGLGGTNYSYDIPTDCTFFIFNSGQEEGAAQTVDIYYDSAVTGWYPLDQTDENGHYLVGTWTDGGGGGTSGTYYLIGYIDGADYGDGEDYANMGDYQFSNGQVSATFNQDSYVCVKSSSMVWYMTDGWQGTDVTSATLYDSNITGTSSDKLYVPAGSHTFTLTENSDGTLTLSYDGGGGGGGQGGGGGETTGTRTIQFTDNKGWGTAYIYVYGPSGENAAWPGVLMTSLGDNGLGGTNYSYDIPTDTEFMIFSNGIGLYEGGSQTVDVPYDGSVTGWYPTDMNGDGKYEVDTWTGGGEDPTSGGGGTTGSYYLIGYIDGADYGDGEDYANMGDYHFVNGQVTATFNEDSYVCVKDTNMVWYMTQGFLGTDVTSATLYNSSVTGTNSDKLYVPAGTHTFTLSENGDGTLTLSYDGSSGGGGEQTNPPATDPPATTKTINVGVVYYLNGTATYQVHWWDNSGNTGDADLTSTGATAQQSVGSSYWSGAAQEFNMYTAQIPNTATGFKVWDSNNHWYGADGNASTQSSAYVFEYGGSYNAYYS